MNRIDGFVVDPTQITYIGHDLSRPECIIAERDGTLWIADNRGSITHIEAQSGIQRLIGPNEGVPNGIAMTARGDFVVADIGAGNIYQIDRSGDKKIILDSLDGKRLGAVNFVYLDEKDRLWVAVSTVTEPRSDALVSVIPDGYILLIDEQGTRRVADGLRFTNEIRIDSRGEFLYVAETTAGGITRFRVAADGSLDEREKFGPMPFFEGAMVDGIAFDVDGNLWVTEVTRNQIVVLKPDGTALTVFDDPAGTTIDFPTSVTFGGDDLQTVYVGSLKMSRIATFRSPVAGVPMRHWQKGTERTD
ncbi:SMP-30/gluconolactonase/LRE family protein [Caballeronia sp. SEWSISQ10-4 2]|uniref:SMP-30/gluconolactonase/LRE family protein n=1 Tax=Caballeronia sp. SEWSISQ10-4 2 TaxID=2937438 RepID=UPI002651A6CF|nr:SMP-30/gluconolactonase/LRE family protein [Caballeronia sp. SEWSISQ10-4 2]MDN7177069.1 SMP-30/gluconolactonase/LRE family protein [Caballeronia sp. SEWSISQ10-4 2]